MHLYSVTLRGVCLRFICGIWTAALLVWFWLKRVRMKMNLGFFFYLTPFFFPFFSFPQLKINRRRDNPWRVLGIPSMSSKCTTRGRVVTTNSLQRWCFSSKPKPRRLDASPWQDRLHDRFVDHPKMQCIRPPLLFLFSFANVHLCRMRRITLLIRTTHTSQTLDAWWKTWNSSSGPPFKPSTLARRRILWMTSGNRSVSAPSSKETLCKLRLAVPWRARITKSFILCLLFFYLSLRKMGSKTFTHFVMLQLLQWRWRSPFSSLSLSPSPPLETSACWVVGNFACVITSVSFPTFFAWPSDVRFLPFFLLFFLRELPTCRKPKCWSSRISLPVCCSPLFFIFGSSLSLFLCAPFLIFLPAHPHRGWNDVGLFPLCSGRRCGLQSDYQGKCRLSLWKCVLIRKKMQMIVKTEGDYNTAGDDLGEKYDPSSTTVNNLVDAHRLVVESSFFFFSLCCGLWAYPRCTFPLIGNQLQQEELHDLHQGLHDQAEEAFGEGKSWTCWGLHEGRPGLRKEDCDRLRSIPVVRISFPYFFLCAR